MSENYERIIDYIKSTNDDKNRVQSGNYFYAGLIFGLLAMMTLWIIWGVARWAMGI